MTERFHMTSLREGYSESTLFKVYNALRGAGLGEPEVMKAIQAMQNAGILFREMVPTTMLSRQKHVRVHETNPIADRFRIVDGDPVNVNKVVPTQRESDARGH